MCLGTRQDESTELWRKQSRAGFARNIQKSQKKLNSKLDPAIEFFPPGGKRGKCLKIKRGIFARRRGRKLEMKKRSWVFRMPTTGADVIYKLQVTVTILC